MPQTIESAGATSVIQADDNTYFMDSTGGAAGPQIRYNGAPWTVGQNGSWRVIGAEQMSNGYSVWWQFGAANQFVQWSTDLAGNYTSNGAFLTGISYALQSTESTFQQDLNGDGTIGVVSSEIETVGNAKLAQVADLYFVYTGDGSSGVILRKDGGTPQALGVEQRTDGDYDVVMKLGSDQYEEWQFRANGDFLRRPFPFNPIHGSSFQMQDLENRFQQDFNGDGTIGVVSSEIETAGNTKLAQVADLYFMYQGDGSSGVVLRYNGAPWTVGQNGAWKAIGAEQTANGYSVWWRNGTADQYVRWNTDLAGNYTSNGEFATGGSSALQSYESSFQQDLNGDGTIGFGSSEIETVGNTKLARVADMFFMYQGDGSSGVLLRYNGSAVNPGGPWQAIGAEQMGSGYSVWLSSGVGQFVEWNTDSSGNYVSSGSSIVSSMGYALESSEPDFHQDLNGDGTLGVVTTSIETVGNAKLAQLADLYFVYTGDGSSGVILRKDGGTPQALGVEQRTDGDYDVVMKLGSDQYEEWQFRANGDFLRRPFPFNPIHGSSFQMQDLENRFQQDFNGNSVIGAGSSGSSGAGGSVTLLANYMASAFVSPAGEGAGVVAGAQTSDQDVLTKPVA